MHVDQINSSGIVERYIVFKTSGSIKERTLTSSEMGAGCQRNMLVMGVGRGEEVCRKGCPYIRQSANCNCNLSITIEQNFELLSYVILGFKRNERLTLLADY